MWQSIETAPKGKYENRTVLRDGKPVVFSDFVAPRILLALNGKAYLTAALPDGRWNGMSKKDEPSHWMPIPEIPKSQ